jgi:hypothetical protein
VNVPFAQQYDPRFIHQQNYSKTQQIQSRRPQGMRRQDLSREMSGEMVGDDVTRRERMDSEEDDRFSSGRESNNSKTPQLARSISESSQRKISISSDDYKLNDSNTSEKTTHREIISWENEAEMEFMYSENADLSLSSNKSQEHLSAAAERDDTPKQILQRKKEAPQGRFTTLIL